MAELVGKRFESPDEVREFTDGKGRVDLVAERAHDRRDKREAVLALVSYQDTEMISPVHERSHQPVLKSNKGVLTDLVEGVVSILASPQPSAGNAFRLRHSVGVCET
jgi:hypothetical protein